MLLPLSLFFLTLLLQPVLLLEVLMVVFDVLQDIVELIGCEADLLTDLNVIRYSGIYELFYCIKLKSANHLIQLS